MIEQVTPEPDTTNVGRISALEKWYNDYLAEEPAQLYWQHECIEALWDDKYDQELIDKLIHEKVLQTTLRDGLCTTCRMAFDGWPDRIESLVPIGFFDTITLAAGEWKGCRSCATLLTGLREEDNLMIWRKIELRLRELDIEPAATLVIRAETKVLDLNFPNKQPGRLSVLMPRYRYSLDPNAKLIPWQAWSVTAKSWIANCHQHHATCSHAADLAKPTRLLSIAGTTRLVLTADMGPLPPYAALSYCWGKDANFYKLTKSTLATMLDGVDAELPRTIEDAIRMTREMGIDYIWIDALCIIQGDAEDWATESLTMQDIYGGAHVCIAAASASDVHRGLQAGDWIDGYYVQIKQGRLQVQQSNVYEHHNTHSHLTPRGWTFQERLLAPRTISFGDVMRWECRELFASHDLPDGCILLQDERKLQQRLLRQPTVPWTWAEIMSAYSKTELTFAKDRLTALAGIAKQQYKITGDTYLAGMWRSELVEQLAWHAGVPLYPRPQVDPKPPSWSWASISGWAYLDGGWMHTKHAYAQVLDAKVDSKESFGIAGSGEIQLYCEIMFEAFLAEVQPSTAIVVAPQYIYRAHLDAQDDFTLEQSLWLLPLRQRTSTNPRFSAPDATDGLVLQKIGDGVFRRIGSTSFIRSISRPHEKQNVINPLAEEISLLSQCDSRTVVHDVTILLR